jgi:hypothetical protein
MADKKKGITALSPQNVDPLWKVLDEKIGGRQGLLELALSSQNPKAAILAELCLDKAHGRSGTKALARKAGMSTAEIVDLYRNKKWLEATLELHDRLPDIIGGAAVDASPKMTPCEECKGKGKDHAGEDCWICGGWGEVRKPGDKDKLNFVGEAAGIIKRGGPAVQINNQQINNTVNNNESFEDLMRRATLSTKRQIEQPIEIEVIGEKKTE